MAICQNLYYQKEIKMPKKIIFILTFILLLISFINIIIDFKLNLLKFSLMPVVDDYHLKSFFYFILAFNLFVPLYLLINPSNIYIKYFVSICGITYSGFIILFVLNFFFLEHYCKGCSYVPNFIGEKPWLTILFSVVVLISTLLPLTSKKEVAV